MSDYQKELEDRIDKLQEHIERASASIIITVARFITKTPDVVDKIKIYVSYKGITDPDAGWQITSGGMNQTLAAKITLSDAIYYIETARGSEQIVDKEDAVIGYVIDKLGFGGADRIDDPTQDTTAKKNMSIGDMINFQKVIEETLGKNGNMWNVTQYQGQLPFPPPGPAMPKSAPPAPRIDVPPQPWMNIRDDNRSN
jgi:hypothetical protein